MRRTAWLAAAIFGMTLLARGAPGSEEGAVEAAETSAKAWLALVDAGNYGASWREASALFKKQVSEEQWKAAVASARQPFGAMTSRRLGSARYARSLPGAPDGEYVVIQFDTSFEKKKEAVETVTPMKDADGVWRVSGYYIR
jgi:hypothetical protein